MREIRPSGSEGGVAHTRHPYPYLSDLPPGDGGRVITWRRGLAYETPVFVDNRYPDSRGEFGQKGSKWGLDLFVSALCKTKNAG